MASLYFRWYSRIKISWQALHRFLRLPVGFWTKLAPQPQTAGGVGALATRACSRILRWHSSFLARSRSALQGKQNFFLPLGAPMPMPHASQRPFKRFTALTVKSAKEPLGRHPCPSDFTILTLIQLAPVGGGPASVGRCYCRGVSACARANTPTGPPSTNART